MEQFDSNYGLIIGGIIAIAIELLLGVATGFDLFLIGGIAIIAGVVGLLVNSFPLALLLIGVLSLAYVLFGRQFIRSKVTIQTKATNVDALIGKNGVVVKKITEKTPGQVKLEGETWRAESDSTIDENETVRVKSVSGVTISVGKV